MSKTTPEQIIETAKSQIGYKEGEKNDNKYGKWMGFNNVSWCAEFVSWVFGQNNASDLIPQTYNKKGFCSCPSGVAWFRNKKAFITPDKAKPGFICFFDWNKDGVSDHTGIVVKIDLKKKLITCIEGNTGNGANQSDGDGVYERTRPFAQVLGIGKVNF